MGQCAHRSFCRSVLGLEVLPVLPVARVLPVWLVLVGVPGLAEPGVPGRWRWSESRSAAPSMWLVAPRDDLRSIAAAPDILRSDGVPERRSGVALPDSLRSGVGMPDSRRSGVGMPERRRSGVGTPDKRRSEGVPESLRSGVPLPDSLRSGVGMPDSLRSPIVLFDSLRSDLTLPDSDSLLSVLSGLVPGVTGSSAPLSPIAARPLPLRRPLPILWILLPLLPFELLLFVLEVDELGSNSDLGEPLRGAMKTDAGRVGIWLGLVSRWLTGRVGICDPKGEP